MSHNQRGQGNAHTTIHSSSSYIEARGLLCCIFVYSCGRYIEKYRIALGHHRMNARAQKIPHQKRQGLCAIPVATLKWRTASPLFLYFSPLK